MKDGRREEMFMIRAHPTEDLLMVQVDNNAIQLNAERQERLYKILKERFEEASEND